MDEPLHILMVENLPEDAELAQQKIRKLFPSCLFQRVETRDEFLAAIETFHPDLIISNYHTPHFDGLSALKLARERTPLTPVIILTTAMNEDTAVECMKSGAADYVIKEHVKRLGQAVLRALEEKKMRIEGLRTEEEKKKLEAQLVDSQKDEAIGRLAGGVAHDFNNMLSVILGRVDLLKAKLPPGDPLLKDILEIEKAALHSRNTTSQLLAFSQKQVIMPRIMDLNALIAKAQKPLGRIIGKDSVLYFHPGKDLWKIKCDPSQMNQILVNLAVNARDAMPDGGSLTIATENASIDEAYCREHLECTPGRYALLTVSDDGSGMDRDTLAKLFEPFFTTKEVGQGMGLGLSMIYGVVKQNQGFLDVSSEPGQGTTFKIFFPGAEEDAEAPQKNAAVPMPDKGEDHPTILLVEDDPMVRELISVMLGEMGYSVIVAETPQAALSLCEKEGRRISMLLTDVIMPVMSGKELSDKVKSLLPGIRILFMSGYPFEEIADRGLLDEEVHFIQKPFTMKVFSKKISAVLGMK